MSTENLVTVKAEALRLAPYGFEFYAMEYLYRFSHFDNDLNVPITDTYASVICHIGYQVSPTAYTAAVIDRICEQYEYVHSIIKTTGGITVWFEETHSECKSCCMTNSVAIVVDPWPWAETGEWIAP